MTTLDRDDLATILIVVGFGVAVAGAALFHPFVALLLIGFGLMFIGWRQLNG